jgi:hypothetical protein
MEKKKYSKLVQCDTMKIKKNRQKKARRIMILASIRMSKSIGVKFNRVCMEDIRDVYMDMFGVDSLIRRFDIASIVA